MAAYAAAENITANVKAAHTWLLCIAKYLRYPLSSFSASDTSETSLTRETVKQEMEELLQQLRPDLKRRPAQAALYHA